MKFANTSRGAALAFPLKALIPAVLAAFGLCACSSEDPASGSGAAGGAGGSGGEAAVGSGGGGGYVGEPTCTEPASVPCEDQVVLGMNFKSEPAPGAIRSEPDGAGFRAFIDATAGGAFTADPTAYVYGRFTDSGLEKVQISDEQSLGSMDWDIAFRRYVVRINSGHSGPSCVTVARLPNQSDYEATVSAPESAVFRKDDYFTESCELIPDGSGLENSPATALSSYWRYPGCVAMSGNVYALQLADGKRIKLTVTSFYAPDVQVVCDAQGMVPMGSVGANIELRWAFLP